MTSPAEDVRDYLVAQALIAEDNAFVGPALPSPDVTVSVTPTGGSGPDLVMGATAAARRVFRRPRVQVLVRGVKDGYEDAASLMEDIHATLLAAAFTSNGNEYAFCTALAEPLYIGQDPQDERPVFTVNYELMLRG